MVGYILSMRELRKQIVQSIGSNSHDDEWIGLKQYIAYNINVYSNDYDHNLQIYCDVISNSEFTVLVKSKVLPKLKPDENVKGLPQLIKAIEESETFLDTYVIYNELRNFTSHNEEQHKWVVTREIRELLKQKQSIDFPIPSVIKNLKKKYNLLDEELRIISILYLWEEWDVLNHTIRFESDSDFLKTLSGLCRLTLSEFAKLTYNHSNLRKKGLIRDQGRHIHKNMVELNPALLFAINSKDLNMITSEMYRETRKAKYKPAQFPVPQLEKEFIFSALRVNKSVLIAGEPGVGKTEFAYGVAEYLGKKLMNLSTDPSSYSIILGRSIPQDRMIMVRIASNLIQSDKEILLIDEADTLLQNAGGIFSFIGGDGSYDKGELNSLLEDMSIPAIWITNSIERIPASSLRRFAYVYNFPHPNMKIRERMLEDTFTVDDVPRDLIRNVSRQYDLTPSAMGRMVKIVESMVSSSSEKRPVSDIVNCYLDTSSKGPLKNEFRKLPSVSEYFNPELSSTSIPLNKIVIQIRKRLEKGIPTRILFEGPPGGGKTQFSLYLSYAVGKEAIIKKPSDLLSPYVGVAEKNISSMFREAEASGSILILDEADAFFGDRSNAHRSWELSQASEFLQGIQDFKGILIACTNRVESLDPAIRRRFHQNVTFGFLDNNLIGKALKHMFPDVIFSKDQIKLLKSGPSLMMSDIANSADMLVLDDCLEADMIIDKILENAKNRDMSNTIGF